MAARKPSGTWSGYDDYVRSKMCGDKVAYSGELPARNAATALGWVAPQYQGMEAYLCKYCHDYHVGHAQYRTTLGLVPTDRIVTPETVRQMIEKEKDKE